MCRARGAGAGPAAAAAAGSAGGGQGAGRVHESVVNQLLSKLDGLRELDNILVVGTTNRKDLIDPAILRPGRLEVHAEIGLPDARGRAQIFAVHCASLARAGALALAPPARADADAAGGGDADDDARADAYMPLARLTPDYSGAEIEALVRAATSHALSRARAPALEGLGEADLRARRALGADVGGDAPPLVVTDDDFALALREVRPMFGTDFDPAMVAFLAAHGARDDDALEGARGLKRECVDVELIRAMGAADVDGLPGIPYGVKVRIKRSM